MKKRPKNNSRRTGESDMQSEYEFDYNKAKPNRFAVKAAEQPVVVALEPDVAEVFTSAESVNKVLRALIRSMPKTGRRKAGA
jgi:hypothetical protein